MTSHTGISTGSADTAQSGIRPDARITAGPSGPTSARVAAVTAVGQTAGIKPSAALTADTTDRAVRGLPQNAALPAASSPKTARSAESSSTAIAAASTSASSNAIAKHQCADSASHTRGTMTSHTGISTIATVAAISGIRSVTRITAGPSGPTRARVAAGTAVGQTAGIKTIATEAANTTDRAVRGQPPNTVRPIAAGP